MTTIAAQTIIDLRTMFGTAAEPDKLTIRRIIELLSSDLGMDPIPHAVRAEVLALRETGTLRSCFS